MCLGVLGGKKLVSIFKYVIFPILLLLKIVWVFFFFLQETDLAKLWKNLTKFLNVNKHQQKL